MKFSLIIFASLLLTLTFTQCCKKNKAVIGNDGLREESSSTQSPAILKLNPITINTTYVWPGTTDQFNIESSSIKGDSLFLKVNYGGGCETHDFNMTTNMMWLKSNPPQLNLYLEHNAHGDKCRAMINETLAFDLSQIRYKEKGSVRLIINENRDASILYEY